MRFLILSDIHANVDALDTVLAAAPRTTWDRVLVLGDLVGYGAEPNAVIERVIALDPLAVIRGNHDKAACRLADASDFNHVARTAALWTAQTLTPENRMYLERLPPGPRTIDDSLEICHGSPFDEDHYVFDPHDASRALDAASRPVCLFGHTHLPIIYRRDKTGDAGFVPHMDDEELQVPFDAEARYLVNPGSVGQPRDGDPRAAWLLVDIGRWTASWRRVEYPIAEAAEAIAATELPRHLADRLFIGQ